MELLRDTGLAMYAALFLWLAGCAALTSRRLYAGSLLTAALKPVAR